MINAFREHMANYDLSEHSIFEKFNWEVRSIALDIMRSWGPMNPPYLRECAEKINDIAKDASRVNSKEIMSNNVIYFNLNRQDSIILAKMEINDSLCNTILTCADVAMLLPQRYKDEKDSQCREISDMGLDNKGDFIRPQVVAVMDLLLAGIVIDYDFTKKFDDLVTLTDAKCDENCVEMNEFNSKMWDIERPGSIPHSLVLTHSLTHSLIHSFTHSGDDQEQN